jgi:hypothetical protein
MLKVGSNGKDPIEIADSPPKADGMPMDYDDDIELTQDDEEKASSLSKLISAGGLDEDAIGDNYDDAKTSVSLLDMFDSAQASESADEDDKDNSNNTHQLANAIMQEKDDDNTDTYDDKDNKLTTTSDHNDNNQTTNDNKNNETNKNNKNKNKNSHSLTNNNDHTGKLADHTANTTTVLSFKTLKIHTSKWTTLSQQAKNIMPYIDTDRDNA